jgi:hypothetical protein
MCLAHPKTIGPMDKRKQRKEERKVPEDQRKVHGSCLP